MGALTMGAVALAAASAPMSSQQVIQWLDQTIDWYRTLAVQQQAANEPSDMLILYENRQIANQVTAFAFDVARANADLLAKDLAGASAPGVATPGVATPGAAAPGAASPADAASSLTQVERKLDAQTLNVQTELDSNRARLKTAPPKTRPALQARITELNDELDLVNTKKSIIASMSRFQKGSDATGSPAGALRAQIDAMAVALPASEPPATPGATAAPGAHAPAANSSNPLATSVPVAAPSASRFGLWDLAAEVLRLSEKKSTVDSVAQRTAALQATIGATRERLIDQLRALSARGDALAAEADTADRDTLENVHGQFDVLAAGFKDLSAMFVPLSKERLLLDQYRRNLDNWRGVIDSQTHAALKTLGLRVGILAIILAVVFALAELWRRTVLRYVQDTRRRYQFMLLRRIAISGLVLIIIGFAFASELGSIVTFAGLITAGLAVAMQSVLVSIVGYFFLIGKYGIRVGDRVQIGEVSGEVIELGLVRMYLMEFGRGSSWPTGRVVAFANSVVFQVSSGLFKQIPGVNVAWREITLSVPPGADYLAVKEQLNAAVIEALEDYRGEIERQTHEIQRATLSNSGGEPLPTVQLIYAAGGVEAHVRYPVHSQHAAEIDERVSRALAQVMSQLHPPGAAT